MNLKAALFAIVAAGAFLLVGACGGGVDGSSSGDNKIATPGSGNADSSGSPAGSGSTGSIGSAGSSDTAATVPFPTSRPVRTCQPDIQTTVAGGDLFAAEQGPVGLTLLSDGGLSLSQYTFTVFYDPVYGISTSNQQDKWGRVELFPAGTPIGTSTQVQLLSPTTFGFPVYGPMPSTFPKGIPVQLSLQSYDGTRLSVSSTASLGKEIPTSPSHVPIDWHQTSVTYGPNNTATVSFFGLMGASFSVALTNVCGSGLPSS